MLVQAQRFEGRALSSWVHLAADGPYAMRDVQRRQRLGSRVRGLVPLVAELVVPSELTLRPDIRIPHQVGKW